MNPLSLDHLSLLDIDPALLIELAGELNIPLVGLWVHAPVPANFPLVTRQSLPAVQHALRQSGVRVYNLECFDLAANLDVASLTAPLALGAELGAKSIVAINYQNRDHQQADDYFAALCGLARRYDLIVNLEFFPASQVRNLADACAMVRRCGADNARVTVDILHLMRSGGSPALLAGEPKDLTGYAQLCDGPLSIAPEEIGPESFEERAVPGAGAFPLDQFTAALPQGIPLGIEVPSRSLRAAGLTPRERVKQIVDATRRITDQQGVPHAAA